MPCWATWAYRTFFKRLSRYTRMYVCMYSVVHLGQGPTWAVHCCLLWVLHIQHTWPVPTYILQWSEQLVHFNLNAESSSTYIRTSVDTVCIGHTLCVQNVILSTTVCRTRRTSSRTSNSSWWGFWRHTTMRRCRVQLFVAWHYIYVYIRCVVWCSLSMYVPYGAVESECVRIILC